MANRGYDKLTERAFVSFAHDLNDGAWQEVSIRQFQASDPNALPAELVAAPRPVVWKLRATWALRAVHAALAVGSTEELEADWDSAQRRLFHALGMAADSKQVTDRSSARRLQALLLDDDVTSVTRMDREQKIERGRRQGAVAIDPHHAAEMRRLGIDEAVRDVAEATEALSEGGRGDKAVGPRVPSPRLRAALVACVAEFESVHDEMLWFTEHLAPGPARDLFRALLAPFQSLLLHGRGARASSSTSIGAIRVAPPQPPPLPVMPRPKT